MPQAASAFPAIAALLAGRLLVRQRDVFDDGLRLCALVCGWAPLAASDTCRVIPFGGCVRWLAKAMSVRPQSGIPQGPLEAASQLMPFGDDDGCDHRTG
jgi:hypothetical protein